MLPTSPPAAGGLRTLTPSSTLSSSCSAFRLPSPNLERMSLVSLLSPDMASPSCAAPDSSASSSSHSSSASASLRVFDFEGPSSNRRRLALRISRTFSFRRICSNFFSRSSQLRANSSLLRRSICCTIQSGSSLKSSMLTLREASCSSIRWLRSHVRDAQMSERDLPWTACQ